MNKFETMDNMNTNFVALSDQELMEMEGGIAPIIIGGVVIGWKTLVGVGAVVVGGGALGVAAGYYANRP